jgi:hypothetical protein
LFANIEELLERKRAEQYVSMNCVAVNLSFVNLLISLLNLSLSNGWGKEMLHNILWDTIPDAAALYIL